MDHAFPPTNHHLLQIAVIRHGTHHLHGGIDPKSPFQQNAQCAQDLHPCCLLFEFSPKWDPQQPIICPYAKALLQIASDACRQQGQKGCSHQDAVIPCEAAKSQKHACRKRQFCLHILEHLRKGRQDEDNQKGNRHQGKAAQQHGIEKRRSHLLLCGIFFFQKICQPPENFRQIPAFLPGRRQMDRCRREHLRMLPHGFRKALPKRRVMGKRLHQLLIFPVPFLSCQHRQDRIHRLLIQHDGKLPAKECRIFLIPLPLQESFPILPFFLFFQMNGKNMLRPQNLRRLLQILGFQLALMHLSRHIARRIAKSSHDILPSSQTYRTPSVSTRPYMKSKFALRFQLVFTKIS